MEIHMTEFWIGYAVGIILMVLFETLAIKLGCNNPQRKDHGK